MPPLGAAQLRARFTVAAQILLQFLPAALGQRDEAASRFAEALWLNAADATARLGLSRALAR